LEKTPMDTKIIAKEKWVELSKKLRNRVQAYFNPDQLAAIDEFIRLAEASFDQVTH
jgi:hypothetical protein